MKYDVSIIPFSHLDLFWAGTRDECLSRGAKVITTALDLLEKHPDYRFMIEACNFLETFLDCYPQERTRLKRFAAEKRLDVIPMRAIIYSHLPSGETTVRNLLYGMDFCEKELGVSPGLMSLSDIPGVTAQLPQIARLAGLDHVVLSRGFPSHTDHVLWTAPDGTSVKGYCPLHYAVLCAQMSHETFEKMGHHEEDFLSYFKEVDYPQIFHWGTDLYTLNETVYQNIRRYGEEKNVRFRFMTFSEFFEKYPDVPRKTISGEVPSTWTHIETSWPDIWPLDVPAEAAFFSAELLASIDQLLNGSSAYPAKEMRTAWYDLLDSMDHNQNGIGGPVADQDKRRLKRAAWDKADLLADRFRRRISVHTTRPNDKASPIIVLNTSSHTRSGIVRARTTCYGTSFSNMYGFDTAGQYYQTVPPDQRKQFRLIDEHGREIPYKKEMHLMMLADSIELSFYAENVPAFGSRVYYVELETGRTEFPSPFTVHDDKEEDRRCAGRYAGSSSIENKFFRVEIHRITGEMTLTDMRNGKIVFSRACLEGREELRGEYIYLMELSGRTAPAVVDDVSITDNNAVYCRMSVRGSVYGLDFEQTVTLYADDPVVDIENKIHWGGKRYVRIEQVLPFSAEGETEIRYGTPFGHEKYTAHPTAEEIRTTSAAQRLVRDWTDISDSAHGVTVASDHRMWSFEANTLRSCMVRGIGWTSGGVILKDDFTEEGVQRPPAGSYTFRYRIAPHDGDAGPLWHVGEELNHPFITSVCANAAVSDHPGLVLPEMPDAGKTSIALSAVKPAEDGGGLVFRYYECMGHTGQSLHLPVKDDLQWFESDLREKDLHPVGPDVAFRPFEIKTLIWKH